MVALEDVLAESQRIGLLGPGPVAGAIEHATRFVDVIAPSTALLVDLGSGGGVPGLVIALARPDTSVVLVDRRGRAADFLRRAVHALQILDQVTVLEADAADVARDPQWRGRADVVTARGVGPPPLVTELALPLLRVGGVLVASCVGLGEGWPATFPPRAGAGTHVLTRCDGLIVVHAGHCPDELPRRTMRPPLF